MSDTKSAQAAIRKGCLQTKYTGTVITWYGVKRTTDIGLSGPALGRPKKDAIIDIKQDYRDICDRVEVERDFSLAKWKCGLEQIFTRLKETTEHTISLAIVVLNLRKVLWAFLGILCYFKLMFFSYEKMVFVQ